MKEKQSIHFLFFSACKAFLLLKRLCSYKKGEESPLQTPKNNLVEHG